MGFLRWLQSGGWEECSSVTSMSQRTLTLDRNLVKGSAGMNALGLHSAQRCDGGSVTLDSTRKATLFFRSESESHSAPTCSQEVLRLFGLE